MSSSDDHTCPLCGALNHCALTGAGHTPVECWCTEARIKPDALARIPAVLLNKACLCPHCANDSHDKSRVTDA
ncbi:MAG: cysteine-rich CWC family protein [Aquabacterium sp.]|nr:cysteine-rich CWC family protein [Aquabacterium sp.]MBI5924245.1 cysteine-rich CWC family protein [Aquabacterium sp.]